ncbi:MAG: cell wall metabolism sensor histidine kinase WalK [Clostridia bacterium]|nr:ATP-binding protein [Anaerotignum sp.]NCC14838.1 cell wall metabolism sensor histidine kinase WalK [Clostridia bacterium]
MRSIKWKLIIMYLGLVLIVMIVSGSYILLSLRNIEVEKSRGQLESYAEKIYEQVIEDGDTENFQETLLRTVPNAVGIQGNILDANGNTIASTTVLKEPYPLYTDQAIVAAMNGTSSFSSGKKSTDSFALLKEWMSYAASIKGTDEEVNYIIYTRLDAGDMRTSLDQTTKTIIIAVAISLLLAVIMGYVFAQTLTGPILALTKGAKNMAEGNFEQSLKVRSVDEIGQLTSSFNYMASELTKNMSEIYQEKNRLEILLHNMSDGVISFKKDGELMLANTAATEMLGVDKIEMDFSDFIRTYDINSGVYLDMGNEPSKKVTFPVGKQFINATFTPYYNAAGQIEGLVVVLQDITEQKKLDDMRKEFVANVSHELRTPLTTVKSYTETLMDGAMEDKEIAMEFLGIIDSEADRMAFLVRDLLQLSRFDNKQVHLDMAEIEMNEFLSLTVKQNKIHAEAKRQDLTFEPYREMVVVHGDRDRVGQVVNNIVTNAMKYSLEQASIKIYITEDDTYYKICVKDTGMGIAREDLPRIFERFYRVDKARSRAMGGTGLGLAIAKEIMESHRGRLTAESEYGKGTTMTMWFPKELPLPECKEV